ncbi:hypothetical protein AAC387_Pa08g1335 [Persea americana]
MCYLEHFTVIVGYPNAKRWDYYNSMPGDSRHWEMAEQFLLRLNKKTLIDTLHTNEEDNKVVLKNFLQHYKELNDLKFEDLFVKGRENEPHDLLTVAATGNYAFLQELLRAGMDPDIGYSKGRTPLHIAVSKGYEDCVCVLLEHSCNVNIQAGKRNDLSTMMELLKHGLNIDSVNFLVMNGANVDNFYPYRKTTTEMAYMQGRFPFSILEEMMQKREVGHQVTVLESPREPPAVLRKHEDASIWRRNDGFLPRVSIYKGHPLLRNSFSEAGEKFGIEKFG